MSSKFFNQKFYRATFQVAEFNIKKMELDIKYIQEFFYGKFAVCLAKATTYCEIKTHDNYIVTIQNIQEDIL